jgi:hypothetical protein
MEMMDSLPEESDVSEAHSDVVETNEPLHSTLETPPPIPFLSTPEGAQRLWANGVVLPQHAYTLTPGILTWDQVKVSPGKMFPVARPGILATDTCIGCNGLIFPDFVFRMRYSIPLFEDGNVQQKRTICSLCLKSFNDRELHELSKNYSHSNAVLLRSWDDQSAPPPEHTPPPVTESISVSTSFALTHPLTTPPHHNKYAYGRSAMSDSVPDESMHRQTVSPHHVTASPPSSSLPVSSSSSSSSSVISPAVDHHPLHDVALDSAPPVSIVQQTTKKSAWWGGLTRMIHDFALAEKIETEAPAVYPNGIDPLMIPPPRR